MTCQNYFYVKLIYNKSISCVPLISKMFSAYLMTTILGVTSSLYIINIIRECSNGICEDTHFWRCIISIVISLMVTAWGLKRKSVDWSGAVGGFVVGLIHSFSSYCFLACLFAFFYTGSKATRFHSAKKRKLEAEFREGGQRNWLQVLCNGGASAEISLLFLLCGGPGEIALDFENNFLRSWLAAAALSAIAGANGDTWASEIGTVMARSEPVLITSLRKVPIGTNGGLTKTGLFFSALGGAVVGLAYLLILFLTAAGFNLMHQSFLLILIGTSAGFFGSLLDSLIGATMQFSGFDTHTGKIVEHPGIGVKHISGRAILNNHSVNMVMTVINSILVPSVTASLCKYFR